MDNSSCFSYHRYSYFQVFIIYMTSADYQMDIEITIEALKCTFYISMILLGWFVTVLTASYSLLRHKSPIWTEREWFPFLR